MEPQVVVRNNKGARAIANDAWEAEEEDELSFPKGAEITDIALLLGAWWCGTYEHRRGLFPQHLIHYEPSTCPNCASLLRDQLVLDQLLSEAGVDHRVTRKDFRSAIEQGCGICVPFYGQLAQYINAGIQIYHKTDIPGFWVFDNLDPNLDDQELAINWSVKLVPHRGPYDIQELNLDAFSGGKRGNLYTRYYVHTDHEDPAANYVSSRPVRQPQFASFDLARRWIDDCFESHQHCPGPELPALPTRVIDVGAEDGADPKLVLSKGQKGWYATLSYCWGGPQPFTLTLATMDSKQQGISVSELPNTYENAIKAARLLNIQYLWIDALCIIQDSEVDKAVEMATMDQVYHNATVTIAAANVGGCSERFLARWVPRSYPEPFQLAKINFPCPNGETGNIFVESGRGYSLDDEPLSKRGWALQERLVSPRVLTFGKHQMWWHCQTVQHSEGGSFDDDFVGIGKKMERLGHDFFQQKGQNPGSTGSNEIYENWRSIVEDYSGRQLTMRTDVLPALSGIATRFASVLNDTYFAGLWKNDLLRCLAWWTLVEGDEARRRPSEYRAPTWSWASIDSSALWWQREAKPTMSILTPTEVLNCQVELVYPMAPFGEVRAGAIELCGLVRDLDWDGSSHLCDADGDFICSVDVDVTLETLYVDADVGDPHPVDFYMGRDKEGDNAIVRRVSCIPVTDHFSLMLERQRDGKYVRLGLVPFWQADNDGFYDGATERTVIIR